MLQMNHRSFAAMLVAAVVAVMALFGTTAADAQPPPPCGGTSLTITNLTPCGTTFCVEDINGSRFCRFVPANQSISLSPGAGVAGVVHTGNNITYPFVPNPFIPGGWWVPNIRLGACCSDVIYDLPSCTMWIRLTTSPPPCQ